MKKLLLISSLGYLVVNFQTTAQSVAINNDGSLATIGTILDIQSTNKGIIIPRIALTGTNDVITVPDRPESLLIYNTGSAGGSNAVSPGYYYWNGSLWVRLITDYNFYFSAWLMGGNAGTTPSTHFLGTTDNNSLLFKVNNQRAGYIGVEENDGNVFWGYQSGKINTAYSNVGIGAKALHNNTTISNLVAVGDAALFSNTSGLFNTAVGSKSLYSNTSGRSNTAHGFQALYNNITGWDNTANGGQALYSNTTGSYNSGTGYFALYSNTTGDNNTASGVLSLFSNTTGYNNTANGNNSLYSNTTGNLNTANGNSALYSNTAGNLNTANGHSALYSNTTGSSNTANGYQALFKNSTGFSNTANGHNALYNNSTGASNTANGVSSLFSNTTGSDNNANGVLALYSNTTGSYNTANGEHALFSNTTGFNNTAVGYVALNNNTTGSNNTALGYLADITSGFLSNATALGYGALVNASNKVRIGNSFVTAIEGQVPFTTPSDERFKFNIRDDVGGLDFIMKLRPVTYQFDVKRFDENLRSSLPGKENNYATEASYNEASVIRRTGFIAQEVEKAAIGSGYDFSGIVKPKSEKEHYSLSYESFVVPMVKAMQEQQKMIETQKEELLSIKTELAELKKMVEKLSAR